jgi:two-component system invasion response regulator UvrY
MRLRLLLVDDDRDFRATIRHLLGQREEALVVGEAADGEEALRLAGSLLPDVVLMDLAMPRMNGVEATRQIKARWPQLLVVMLTVHDDEAYRRTALQAGAEALLQKKTLGVDLWPTLYRVVGGSGAEPDARRLA